MFVSSWPRRDCFSPMSWPSSLKESCVVVVVVCFVFMLVLSLRARCSPHWLSWLIHSISCFEHTTVVQLQWQQAFKNARSRVTFNRCLVSSFRRACFRAPALLLNNTCQIFDSTSFGCDDGFEERSDVALLQLLFGLSVVPHHTSEFLAMDRPPRRSPSTSSLALCQTSPASQAHHIHQLFLRSVDVLNSGRHQIAASAALGTRLYGKMTRHHHCAARLWTSALHDHKAAAEQLGHVSRLTKMTGQDVNGHLVKTECEECAYLCQLVFPREAHRRNNTKNKFSIISHHRSRFPVSSKDFAQKQKPLEWAVMMITP